MRKLYVIASLLLCLQLGGVHWMALQCVAWVNMAIQYSQSSGVGDGLSKTFDGQHPCPLCKMVDRGTRKETEKNGSSVVNVKLVVFPPQLSRWIFSSPRMEGSFALSSFFGPQRTDKPPVPPPRHSLV